MFPLSSITFKAALPRGTSPSLRCYKTRHVEEKSKDAAWRWPMNALPCTALLHGWRNTNPIGPPPRRKRRKGFLEGVFSCRTALKSLPGRQNLPPPAFPRQGQGYEGFQTAPAHPREGRGAAPLLWLHVISAHHCWQRYRSPCILAGCYARLCSLPLK